MLELDKNLGSAVSFEVFKHLAASKFPLDDYLWITVLSKAPKTTINELVEITGMSRRGIEDMLKRMKQSGKIRRVGATKGGHWEVINQ